MQSFFPNDKRFSAENFAFNPTYIIFQALEYGNRFYKEDKHYSELGIATLTSYFVNANRDPKKGKSVAPQDFFFFKPERVTDIHPNVAATFFSLASSKNMPSWGPSCVPLKEMVALRSKGVATSPRAFLNEDVLLISPEMSGSYLFCGFAMFWDVDVTKHPYCNLTDPDNGKSIRIITPTPEQGNILKLVYSNYYVSLV